MDSHSIGALDPDPHPDFRIQLANAELPNAELLNAELLNGELLNAESYRTPNY
jgi:hypothetical protein